MTYYTRVPGFRGIGRTRVDTRLRITFALYVKKIFISLVCYTERVYNAELSKSLSCLSDNRSGRCGQCVRPIKHLPDLHFFTTSTELHMYWLNP